MEIPFFFGDTAEYLFGVAHLPADSQPSDGIVLCHAFGEEKLWSHRTYVNLAREAAARGIAAFRFDFRGHGDSTGHSEDNSLANFDADIESAIAAFLEKCPTISNLGLLGLRFGGSLAARFASRHDQVGRLILWDPIVDGARYMQELLRINLSTQLAVYGKVQANREVLVKKMEKGEFANVDGYLINHDFFRECSELSLSQTLQESAYGKALVVQIAPNIKQKDRDELLDLAQPEHAIDFLKVEEPPFWREIKPFTSRARNLVGGTLDWWEENK